MFNNNGSMGNEGASRTVAHRKIVADLPPVVDSFFHEIYLARKSTSRLLNSILSRTTLFPVQLPFLNRISYICIDSASRDALFLIETIKMSIMKEVHAVSDCECNKFEFNVFRDNRILLEIIDNRNFHYRFSPHRNKGGSKSSGRLFSTLLCGTLFN